MSQALYITWSATTSALTAQQAGVSISGSLKTILQVKPGSKIQVVEWGYLLNTTPSSAVEVELIETGTVFATVTAGNIASYNSPGLATSLATTGTSATGYAATVENTVTATRLLGQDSSQSLSFRQQFPLDREPEVLSGNSLRIRANGTATIIAYIIWGE